MPDTAPISCLACGYDLSGLEPGRPCPECGRKRFKGDDEARKARQEATGADAFGAWIVGAVGAFLVSAAAGATSAAGSPSR